MTADCPVVVERMFGGNSANTYECKYYRVCLQKSRELTQRDLQGAEITGECLDDQLNQDGDPINTSEIDF